MLYYVQKLRIDKKERQIENGEREKERQDYTVNTLVYLSRSVAYS